MFLKKYFQFFSLLILAFFANFKTLENPACQLPPPADLSVQIQGTTAFLEWTAVPNAVQYRITIQNLSNPAQNLPPIFTAQTAATVPNLTPGNKYKFCVSATSCKKGQFGESICRIATVPSIIVEDLIVQFSCPGTPMGPFVPTNGGVARLEFSANSGEVYGFSPAISGISPFELSFDAGANAVVLREISSGTPSLTVVRNPNSGNYEIRKGATVIAQISNLVQNNASTTVSTTLLDFRLVVRQNWNWRQCP